MADDVKTEVVKWYHKGWPMFVVGMAVASVLAGMGYTAFWAWNKLKSKVS